MQLSWAIYVTYLCKRHLPPNIVLPGVRNAVAAWKARTCVGSADHLRGVWKRRAQWSTIMELVEEVNELWENSGSIPPSHIKAGCSAGSPSSTHWGLCHPGLADLLYSALFLRLHLSLADACEWTPIPRQRQTGVNNAATYGIRRGSVYRVWAIDVKEFLLVMSPCEATHTKHDGYIAFSKMV